MTFAQPAFFALAPLIAALWVLRRARSHATILFPSLAVFAREPRSWRALLRAPVLAILTSAALIAFTVALARPQQRTVIAENEKSRNIMLALDISKSMATEDFSTPSGAIDRLSGVKEVVAQFVAKRKEDRIGVVVFGSRAFLQAPLTRDHSLLLELIDKLGVGLAGDGTEMGDGLALALKRMGDIADGAKTVILLTDGVNSSGPSRPLEAATIAAQLGVKVHTIGIGTTAMVQGRGMFFGAARAEFDEQTLKKIAATSKGVYFHAADIQKLQQVYDEIDRLETTEGDEPPHETIVELYPRFLVVAAALFLTALLLNQTIFMKVP